MGGQTASSAKAAKKQRQRQRKADQAAAAAGTGTGAAAKAQAGLPCDPQPPAPEPAGVLGLPPHPGREADYDATSALGTALRLHSLADKAAARAAALPDWAFCPLSQVPQDSLASPSAHCERDSDCMYANSSNSVPWGLTFKVERWQAITLKT